MNITLNLENLDFKFFASQEEYDRDCYSWTGYLRECAVANTDKRTYSGPIMKYEDEPTSFPCILLIGSIQYHSNGPDTFSTFIINQSDFKIN